MPLGSRFPAKSLSLAGFQILQVTRVARLSPAASSSLLRLYPSAPIVIASCVFTIILAR
jgi:hypothetical protein